MNWKSLLNVVTTSAVSGVFVAVASGVPITNWRALLSGAAVSIVNHIRQSPIPTDTTGTGAV